jgi:DNA-directed RNA polymerase specialized sigma24 family protein
MKEPTPPVPALPAPDPLPRAGQFPMTSWDLVAAAAQKGADAPEAKEFANLYYPAIRAFVRSVARDRGEADELTQEFFVDAILSGRVLRQADQHRGRFHVFLKQSIRHFIIDKYRAGRRDLRNLHPDSITGGWDGVATSPAPHCDAVFLRTWAESVVRTALERVAKACEEKGQQVNYQLFAGRYLSATDDAPPWRQLGEAYGLEEKVARSRVDTVKVEFRKAVREIVAADAGPGDRTEEEILELIALL